MKGKTFWLTGISGSGKTTLSGEIKQFFEEKGLPCQVLDGDVLRNQMDGMFGYTKEERLKNSKVAKIISKYLNENGINVIAAFVSPFEDMRQDVRKTLTENYFEIYVKCSPEECARRDPKGHYAKAKDGELKNFSGVTDTYEIPHNSDLVIDTEHKSIEECREILAKFVEDKLCN